VIDRYIDGDAAVDMLERQLDGPATVESPEPEELSAA
jgi:hypothetical protein